MKFQEKKGYEKKATVSLSITQMKWQIYKKKQILYLCFIARYSYCQQIKPHMLPFEWDILESTKHSYLIMRKLAHKKAIQNKNVRKLINITKKIDLGYSN